MKQAKVGVSGILINRNGCILLGRRDPSDTLGGMWCTPGGGVEFGETLDVANVREWKEETNLDVVPISGFQSIRERIHERGHTVMIFRRISCENTAEMRPLDGLVALEWFSLNQCQRLHEMKMLTEMSFQAIIDFAIHEGIPYAV